MEEDRTDQTALLRACADGDAAAREDLWDVVYRDLRSLAARYLRSERPDHTMQPTDLVHEAYVRLIDETRVQVRHREQFFALAAGTMRHILIDHARKRLAAKRGSGVRKISLEVLPNLTIGDTEELVALDDALSSLAAVDADLANLVELRFFGGLKHDEVARHLDVSIATVGRRWRLARAWLYRALAEEPN